MARAFAGIAFTPTVKAAQRRMGSRDAYQAAETGPAEIVELSPYEIEFITARDSFYQATVGENGWPYVQHRGGPIGFLKVLSPNEIGYADFSGNRQYISVGNIEGDGRVSLFLMDYPAQRRLKVWGRARLVDENEEPELVARLESPGYRARVERGVVITIEAFDWNCPKYITPRFTEEEIRQQFSALQQHALAADAAPPAVAGPAVIGKGALKLVVTGLRQLTPDVRAYELQAPDGAELPPFEAGAHLIVPVRLPDGREVTRQYSLTSDPAQHSRYEIAVLREASGRGGSDALHATWQLGTQIALDAPVNQFPLHADGRPALLIAGGIGITPIKAMAHALKARGQPFALHYSAKTQTDIAWRESLDADFPGQVHLYATRGPHATRMDLSALLKAAPPDAQCYVCGPARLINAVRDAAGRLGWPAHRVQFESFE